MGEIIRFISKSELERARLIREARANYERIFPSADPADAQGAAVEGDEIVITARAPRPLQVGQFVLAGSRWAQELRYPADCVIDGWWRFGGRNPDRRLVLADRCLFDTLVDLAADTGLDELILGPLGRWLVRRLPAPRLVVVLSRPVAQIRRDRPDALLDRKFARRRALYQRLAREFELPILENDGTPEALLDRLEQLAASAPP